MILLGRLALVSWSIMVLAACGHDDAEAGAACARAAGTCVLGGAACGARAAESAQDCNPQLNPGGAYCCLDVPDAGSRD